MCHNSNDNLFNSINLQEYSRMNNKVLELMYSKKIIIVALLLPLMILSCDVKNHTKAPDVSHVEADFNWIRFDNLLDEITAENCKEKITELEANYPAFTNLYFKSIVPIYDTNRDTFAERLKGFISNKSISSLIDTSQLLFKNLDKQKEELSQAGKYYKYYFPSEPLPNIYTLISEYAFQSFIFEDGEVDGVGLGLDMFLGKDFDYKKLDPKNPAFADYATRFYNKDFMIKKVFDVVLSDKVDTERTNNLLDAMILEGKKLYILDRILPNVHDTIVMEYSKQELDWAESNELEIWSFFSENELLYKNENMTIAKYINPSPRSAGMPPSAPGKTGAFIGWKIVENFMRQNPNLSLQELIDLDDVQKIVGHYKPARK